jgi:DNA polymerase III subunit delta'
MPFTLFKGQDSAISFLKLSIKNNRLSHAYIFAGPEGVGKRLIAINFAKALNCANMTGYEPCETCPSCKKINESSHPDVSIISPDKEGGSIKIEDVRKIIKDVYLKPFEARKKVYIIDGAESMKHEAANALLKTLEEPPADSILILIAENTNALFQTIVSRSQVVRFFPLKKNEIELILTKEYGVDETNAHILSHLSDGRLGEAIRFRDSDVFAKRASLIKNIASDSLDLDNVNKDDVRLYLDILLSWYSDILNTKAGADALLLVNIDKKDIITNEARRLNFEYLEGVINSIVSTFTYLDQSVNQKLAMSVLGLKINKVN